MNLLLSLILKGQINRALPRNRADGAVILTLVLLPLIFFFPAIIGTNSLLPADGWVQNFGVRALIGQMIGERQWPLWNPLIFAGTPLMASVYPGAFYPPNWLFAILAPGLAMKIVVITSYHLALIGTYLYARRLGYGRSGALGAGVMFAFSGYLIIHLAQVSRIGAAAWLPWILLALENLPAAQSWRSAWRWVTPGAVFIALQMFAGEHQMVLYTMQVVAMRMVFLTCFGAMTGRRRLLPALTAVMVLCGVLLAAAQMLPQIELLRQSERASLSYDYFSSFSLPPQQMLTTVLPYFFGGASAAPYRMTFDGQWNAYVIGSYAGLLGLMLGATAIFSRRERREVGFWIVVAASAMVLAFGGYLPFDFYRVLYHIPGYNLFRGSYRHMFEFSFAMAMLGGIGIDNLTRLAPDDAKRIARRSIVLIGLLVAITACLYRFGRTQMTGKPGAFMDAEAIIPLLIFAGAGCALWFHVKRRSALSTVLLIVMLALDLASFGLFFEWRGASFKAEERMAGPPAVTFIKSRESDLQSFRTLSLAGLPYDHFVHRPRKLDYERLNLPNLSIVHGLQGGLQSVNGYDTLRLTRLAAIAGDMGQGGIVEDVSALDHPHRGLDLLNVKYLLLKRGAALRPDEGVNLAGSRFAITPLHLMLSPGKRFTIEPGETTANELAVVSLMLSSANIPDQAVVVKIRLHTRDNRVIEREMLAGRDTADWAWDQYSPARPGGAVKHRQAQTVESTLVNDPAGSYQGRSYLARFTFDRSVIDRIEFEYARPDAVLQIVRASLVDSPSGATIPLDDVPLPDDRWKKLAIFDDIRVYENLRRQPRAWFVRQIMVEKSEDVLRAIKQGKLRDGRLFDPYETALIAQEDVRQPADAFPKFSDGESKVEISRYEPHYIRLSTSSKTGGMMILSEIFYPGWEALIDGARTPVYRADHILRAVVVPAGEHQIEFVYRPESLRAGVKASAIGLILLIAGAVIGWKTQRAKESKDRR